ncbi:MAG: hypothetical protein ACPGTP_09650 [Bacteroidia bacterium]
MKELILENIGLVLSATMGSFFGWFFTRRKHRAEAQVTEGDALVKMQEAYSQLVEDMNQRFAEMQKRIDELETELEHCKKGRKASAV